eukprot:CAMPEP_0172901854 /NCGR_PEP_ID=MMETSP1075-20121228/167172_1 /TAXON_ID=2916 /ORGANISM="Ceratium fusus, Strain PA161109" /LENGTH=34 /DNA_ID= /DNA_START= /DNA_END= /DNA_ORIENTATION=
MMQECSHDRRTKSTGPSLRNEDEDIDEVNLVAMV